MILLILSINIIELHANDANGVPLYNGSSVTITGVVTANFSSSGPQYDYTKIFVQDSTGGILVYSGDYYEINRGDSVTITGTVSQYNGMTEIVLSSYTVHQTGLPGPQPRVITGRELVKSFQKDSTEPLEGLLVTIKAVHTNGFGTYATGKSYAFADSTGQFRVYINYNSDLSTHPWSGTTIERRPYDITGVVAQYDTSSPYTWFYQIMPRDLSDLVERETVVPVRGPILFKVKQDSITIRIETFAGCYGYVEYGLTSSPGNQTSSVYADSFHVFNIGGLLKDTLYYYRCCLYYGTDTVYTPVYTFRTAPDTLSSFGFISMADSRNDWYIEGAGEDVFNEAFQRIIYLAEEKDAGFILFSGDMIVGPDTRDTLLWQWRNWLDMITIVGRRVPIFTAIGNHENGTYGYAYAEDVYRDMFELPENGPSGYTELVYSFDYGFAHIDVLDSDKTNNEHIIDSTQRDWLKADLENTSRPVRIATAHETAFKDIDPTANCLENYPEERDSVWQIFVDYGVQGYICGHFHHFNKNFYNRTDIPDWMKSVRHIVNGSCGASIYDEPSSINEPHYIFWDLQPDTGIGYVYNIYDSLLDTVILYTDLPLTVCSISLVSGDDYIDVRFDGLVRDRRVKYILERSVNQCGFIPIEQLDSGLIETGFYRDKDVEPGNIYYYRLHIITMFKDTFTDSTGVFFNPSAEPVKIYIVTDGFGINYFAPGGKTKILILDASGRVVERVWDSELSQGCHTFRVEKPDDGVYFLLITGDESLRRRFILMRESVLVMK